MSLYRFYLDGNLLADEPAGWKELTTSIRNYDEIRGILITQDVTLSFVGDGYTYLKNIFDSDQVCALSSITIEYNCNGNAYEEIFRGIVFITSLSFEDEVCKTKLEDDSFFARINNNKNIKAYVDANSSKNGVSITPVTPVDLTMFNVCGCSDLPDDRKAYKIFDCFQYIVQFMTDGIVGFASDYFNTGGEAEGHVIQTGLGLRDIADTSKQRIPFLSFNEIFTQCNKKYNLGIGIEYVGNTPVLRIEPYDYFFTASASVVLVNPSGVKISSDISHLYANVKIGSDKVEPFQDCTQGNPALFPENVDFVGFKKEEFPLLTECNTDKTLDLVSNWVISSNAIQHILTDDPSYDEDMVFIEATRDSSTHHTAVQTDIFNDGNCFYNAFYNNQNTLLRWNSALPNNVIVVFDTCTNLFEAFRRATSSAIVLTTGSPSFVTSTPDSFGNAIEGFEDDWQLGFDGCYLPCASPNNYGNGTPTGTDVPIADSLYTIPTNGNYIFSAGYTLIETNFNSTIVFGPTVINLTTTIKHYDSLGVLIQAYSNTDSYPITTFATQSFISSDTTPVINCTAGDYISVRFNVDVTFGFYGSVSFKFGGEDTVGNGTFFECNFSQGCGGSLTRVVNQNFRGIQFDFNYPLSYTQSKAIKADTKKQIQFNWCGKNYTGFIKDIQYKPSNNSKLTLLTSKNGYRNSP